MISVEEYIANVPVDRKDSFIKLRQVILQHLPTGFEESIGYGMIVYVVPHAIFPAGYHVNPKLPLMFMALASNKNYLSLHHLGLYGNPTLMTWFEEAYLQASNSKLDMGKGCIRFKKMEHIPYELIGQLVAKISVAEFIHQYQAIYSKSKK